MYFGIFQVITDRKENINFQLRGKGVDEEPKGIFKINEQSGQISVTRTLDRETMETYIVSVYIEFRLFLSNRASATNIY